MDFITSFPQFFFHTIPDMRLPDIIVNVVGMLGAVLIGYGIFLETERRQDVAFMIAGMCLLLYAIWLVSPVMTIAMGLFTLTSAYEFIQIMRGKHHHPCGPAPEAKRGVRNE